MRLFLGSFAVWIFALICGGFYAAYAVSPETEMSALSVD